MRLYEDSQITETIIPFWSGIYSQWFPSDFTLHGIKFNCAEQAMMLGKASLFNDEVQMKNIMGTPMPNEQKFFGRQVNNFNEATWNDIALDVVTCASVAKFSQDDSLRSALLDTGNDHIVEASPYDRIWGVGLAPDDPAVMDINNWDGLNWLGISIMNAREVIRQNESAIIRYNEALDRIQPLFDQWLDLDD